MNYRRIIEAGVYMRSVGLLVTLRRGHPIASVLPGVRLPSAQLADGAIWVCGAFDAVYWTADVEQGEQELRGSLPHNGTTAREIWIRGTFSVHARSELEARGWRLHENAGVTAAPPTQGPVANFQ